MLNTFGPQLLVALEVALLPTVVWSGLRAADLRAQQQQQKQQHDPLPKSNTPTTLTPHQHQHLLHIGLASQLCARALVSFTVVLCATVLHSHILVWAIIAPRFVFEICMAAAAAVGALLVAMLVG